MAVGWAWPRGLGAKPQVVAEGLVWVSASPEKQLPCTTLPDPGSPPGHFLVSTKATAGGAGKVHKPRRKQGGN